VVCVLAQAQNGAGPAALPSLTVADLIARGELALRSDPQESRRDAEQALAQLARAPDADLTIRARLILCNYQSERDERAALEQLELARALLPQARRSGLRSGLLTCEGEVRETAGDIQQAKALFDQAVNAAASSGDDAMLAEALFSRGYLLGLRGDYAAGLADLRRSQLLFDRVGKPLHSLTVLDSIAILYNRMGDYAQAQHMYADALRAQRAVGLTNDEAVTLYNLGRTHENLQQWREAAQAFAESLQLSTRIGYTRGQGYALRGLAAAANAQGDPELALKHLERAAALQSQTPDERLRGHIALARGIALHHLGRLEESRAAVETAIAVYQHFDALSELASAEREFAELLADMQDWKGAYTHAREFAAVDDRLRTRQLDQRFATLKVEFDTAATAKENAVLMRQNAADRKALEQARAMRHLQAAVIALTVLLAAALAVLALYLRRSSIRMRALAMTDELTGVPNRRAVLGRLGALLKDPQTGPCAMLILDIDHFKSINDHHGHPAGDEVLKVVADEVRAGVAEPAFFGRLGGEEFLVALPEVTPERALQVAEEFRERITRIDTVRWFVDRRIITASIGLTVSVPGADNPSTMLKRADAALYHAKRSGRNCVRLGMATMPSGPAAPAPAAAPHALQAVRATAADRS